MEPAIIGLMGLGTAVSAYSSYEQGQAAADMARYNQQIAANEAIAARQKAEYDERQHRRNITQVKGTQRAAAAAQGGELLDMGDVFDMTEEQAEVDALAIRYGGKMASSAAQQSGTIAGMQGQQARRQSYAQAGSTLLSGATSGLMYANR